MHANNFPLSIYHIVQVQNNYGRKDLKLSDVTGNGNFHLNFK